MQNKILLLFFFESNKILLFNILWLNPKVLNKNLYFFYKNLRDYEILNYLTSSKFIKKIYILNGNIKYIFAEMKKIHNFIKNTR